MKSFLMGAVIAFLACSGIVHRRLTYFWIDYFQFSIPVAGDLYAPTRGTIELILAGLFLVMAVVIFFRQRFVTPNASYPSRRFPAPLP